MKKLIISAVMCIALMASTTAVAQDSKKACCTKDKTECTQKKDKKDKKECTKKDAKKACCTKDKKNK